MLTRNDYIDYLKQVRDMESSMVGVYSKCLELTDDDYVKRVCSAIMAQEKEHEKMVGKLMELLGLRS